MVVAAVALIVFGPHRLPEIARTIGKTLSELRRQANEIRSEFATSLDETPVSQEEPEPAEGGSARGMEAKPERVDELSASDEESPR